MSFKSDSGNGNNYQLFRECVSEAIVQKSQGGSKKPGKRKVKGRRRSTTVTNTGQEEDNSAGGIEQQDPEELAGFIDFIASEVFHALPDELQTLSYSKVQKDAALALKYDDATMELKDSDMENLVAPIPVSVTESLSVYGILPEILDLTAAFLRPVLTEYIASVTRGPPAWASTRTESCEICERDWIPLSYHHLIPRDVHAKVLKRGWHDEWMLNSVAWLCRACHSFVHRMASNEELAREYYTVDRILARDDVQDWAKWVGRVRWKAL